MDFFAEQEKARKTTRWLVLYFGLCVAGVVAALYVIAVVARGLMMQSPDGQSVGFDFYDPSLLATLGPAVVAVIVLGSLFKMMQLSGGGSVVARDLGGRPVDRSTTEALERRLVNVVDEMAIASGIPAPEIWILDEEDGINAFAAGTDPSNAVIGVTRGTLEQLSRAELQGVVAHEFSHILNGDMKLNMRLIGWVFGLVMIAILGRAVFNMIRYTRTSSRDSKNGGGAILVILGAGVSLWLVGTIGSLFARLLQASISRQREFLADASAVQFTRDPSGLSGALQKVGGFAKHGGLTTPRAQEARHMFFAKSDLAALGLATHPPLDERIRRIDPSWQGKMKTSSADEIRANSAAARLGESSSNFAGGMSRPTRSEAPPPMPALSLAALDGASDFDLGLGRRLREQVARDHPHITSREDAKALLHGLLLVHDAPMAEAARELLISLTGPESAARAIFWAQELHGQSSAHKLALVDLAIPWLRRMNRNEAETFISITRQQIEADFEVNAFEFMLQKVIERHVAIGLNFRRVPSIRYRSLLELDSEAASLLHAFASVSGDACALDSAAAEYLEHTGLQLTGRTAIDTSLSAVAAALDAFEAATPMVKSQIIRLCALVALADDVLEDGEVELLRATADAIGAPIPPVGRRDAA